MGAEIGARSRCMCMRQSKSRSDGKGTEAERSSQPSPIVASALRNGAFSSLHTRPSPMEPWSSPKSERRIDSSDLSFLRTTRQSTNSSITWKNKILSCIVETATTLLAVIRGNTDKLSYAKKSQIVENSHIRETV